MGKGAERMEKQRGMDVPQLTKDSADTSGMMAIKAEKSMLRKMIINERLKLSDEEIAQKSLKICEYLKAENLLAGVKMAFCFKSYKNEVDTEPIIRLLCSLGITICFPRIDTIYEAQAVEDKQRVMNLYEVCDAAKDFKIGSYGIREPDPARCRRIDPSCVDIVLVPGAAFDRSLNRLGYGGGFYDRFFPKTKKNCAKVALAFEMQITDKIPVDVYDTVMDYLITEKCIYQ